MDTDALLEEYAQLLDDLEYEHKRTKFFRMYPPEDRIPNALGKSYAKHIEAIALTKTKQFVSLIGGNGCITPWTLIETAEGPVRVVDLIGKEFTVRSHDGAHRCDAEAHGVFLKSVERAYKVTLSTGRSFSCTAKHRVLTADGWLWLSDVLAQSAGKLHARPNFSRTAHGSGEFPHSIYDLETIQQLVPEIFPVSTDPAMLLDEWWRAELRQYKPAHVGRGLMDLDGGYGDWLFCVESHPELVGGERIVFVAPLGVQPIFDLTVDETACYESAGVFHHNSGKSIWGAVNDTAHATGLYPDWWPGHKFNKPIDGMVAGRSWGDVEKSIQEYLLGKPDDRGTGMIPGDLILGYGPQIPNTRCVEHVRVKHVSGLTSYIYFKSYEQPVLSFEMTNRDYIRLDEEPDFARYAACVQRFRGHTKGGRLLLTFTPEKGATEVVQLFLPEHSNHITPEEYEKSSRGVVVVSQYDVPHKSDEEIEIGALNMDARRRAAKVHGVISAGEGAVYQVEEERFVVDPFPIPDSWPRVWICDPGYDPDPTAVIWAAHDRENGCWYLYREHYLARQPVSVHATAIKLSGDWIPGLFDTQANAVSALSGDHTLLKEYRTHWPAEYRHQLDVVHKIGIEDSVIVVGEWLATGQLKVFSTLKHWLREYRGYRRDEKQKIVDKNNHLMDTSRYLITGGGINAAKVKPRDNRPTVTSHEFGSQWK